MQGVSRPNQALAHFTLHICLIAEGSGSTLCVPLNPLLDTRTRHLPNPWLVFIEVSRERWLAVGIVFLICLKYPALDSEEFRIRLDKFYE